MNRLSCEQVREQIELYAASECEPNIEGLIASHLSACPDCAQACEEAQAFLGSLDLHQRAPDALARLWERLEEEDRTRSHRLRHSPVLRPVLALAAMLLLAVGLCMWAGSAPQADEGGTGSFAVVAVSPGARWERIADQRIRLDSGELRIQSRETARSAVGRLKVITPAAVATAHGTDFFISVGRDPAAARSKDMVEVTVLNGSVELANRLGSVLAEPRETVTAEAGDAPRKQVEDLARRFGQFFVPVSVSEARAGRALALPLNLDRVENWREVRDHFKLQADAGLLQAIGFVVLPGQGSTDVAGTYRDMRRRRIPPFVTADTALHASQLCLEEVLAELEERRLAPDLRALTEALVAGMAAAAHAPSGKLEEAQRIGTLYLAVGLRLLRRDAPLPAGIDADAVRNVVGMIDRHAGRERIPFLEQTEDFAQYQPRGHYTRSQVLAGYFKAMSWFGGVPLLLPDGQVAAGAAKVQTMAAALITKHLAETKLPDGRSAWDVWTRLDAIGAFFVGLSDDLGVQQYRVALVKVCGPRLRLEVLDLDGKLNALHTELSRYDTPAILGGGSQGFRLFGKRFTPDAYVFGHLVAPAVGPGVRADVFTAVSDEDRAIRRGFPRGLDLMALLGSGRARDLLHNEGDDAYQAGTDAPSYDAALATVTSQFDRLSAGDWNRNLYWSHLYCLKALLSDSNAGPLEKTTAYQTRQLDTALASWVLARHAAVLEAKQLSFIKNEQGPAPKSMRIQAVAADVAEGFVEPLPELYARLLAQSHMARAGLSAMQALDEPAARRLARLERLLSGLLEIAQQEARGQALSESQRPLLGSIDEELAGLLAARDGPLAGPQSLETAFVADVYTNRQTGQVLEEATGPVSLGLFVFPAPGGRLLLGAGPVLTYHEFKQPLRERLTDEGWRARLRGPSAPPRPGWANEYSSAAGRYTPLPAD